MNPYNVPNATGVPTPVDGSVQPAVPVQVVDLSKNAQGVYADAPANPYPQPVPAAQPVQAMPQPVQVMPQPVQAMPQPQYSPQQLVYPQDGSQYYQGATQQAVFQAPPPEMNRKVPMSCAGVPDLGVGEAIVMLVLNVFLPGVGTMIGGCMNYGSCNCCIVIIGIIQLFATSLFFGYLWGIISGILAIVYARQ